MNIFEELKMNNQNCFAQVIGCLTFKKLLEMRSCDSRLNIPNLHE